MKKFIATLAIATLTTATNAASLPFAQADANADGQVTMEEAKIALPDVEEALIVAADTDGNGALSEEEYTALTTS